MKVRILTNDLYNESADTKIVFYNKDGEILENTKDVNDEMQKLIDYSIKETEFKDVQNFNLPIYNKPNKLILVGLGDKDKLNSERIRKVVGKAIKESKKINAKSIEIVISVMMDILDKEEFVRLISETAILADYKFDKYLSDKKKSPIEVLNIICNKEDYEKFLAASNEGCVLGNATVIARNLVNEPANILVPSKLGEEVKKLGEICGFEVDVLDECKIKELGMESYLEVAKASNNPPKLIVMRYLKDENNKENVIGLIGKGVTFDSGGLSLKRGERFKTMKHDMAGAASVVGAMSAIASLKLKVNVIGIIAACENMVSGNSYRPGDIINSMAGKTIFIGSTDAEGRLTLIDAIHYAIENEGVKKIVDIASLTGVARMNFGSIATAVLCNDDDFYSKLQCASQKSDEKIWRMPMFEEYKELIKSDIADLTNSAGEAGMITAGLFINEFVQNKPWIHMDIAGTCWIEKELEYISSGGTGVGVRSLYYLVKELG
jgi:leucyl aminopeptidase